MSSKKPNGILSASSHLKAKVESAVTLAQSSKKRVQLITAFSEALSNVEEVTQSIPFNDKGFAQTKKSLKVVANLLGGIVDGLDSHDLSLKELRSVSKDLVNSAVPAFMDALSADSSAKTKNPDASVISKVVIALDENSESLKESLSVDTAFKRAMKDALNNIKTGSSEHLPETLGGEEEQPTTDATRTYLNSLKNLKSSIPATVSNFDILRLPVVPVFHPTNRKMGAGSGQPTLMRGQPNPSYVLQQAGIRATRLEEYVIIDNQLLLAINKSTIPKAEVGPTTKRTKVGPTTKRTKVVTRSALDYAKIVLSTINDTSNKSYTLVDDTAITNPRNSDIVFFWVMPDKTLSFLLKKGFPKLLQWGLPF